MIHVTARRLSRGLAPSVAPACGGWIGDFGLEQADAEPPAMLVDALDHLPVELELADDSGGKADHRRATERVSVAACPGGVKLERVKQQRQNLPDGGPIAAEQALAVASSTGRGAHAAGKPPAGSRSRPTPERIVARSSASLTASSSTSSRPRAAPRPRRVRRRSRPGVRARGRGRYRTHRGSTRMIDHIVDAALSDRAKRGQRRQPMCERAGGSHWRDLLGAGGVSGRPRSGPVPARTLRQPGRGRCGYRS